MLAASWAMDYFDTCLKGMKFKLFTDHKPLETLQNFLRSARANEHFQFYSQLHKRPVDFLSQNVCKAIDVFDSKLPNLQEEDSACKVIHDFIQNMENQKANQKPFKSAQANDNLIK